jgi:MFS family permease
MRGGALALHPGVLRLAFTHFVIDVYSNILTPLLRLFIPQMHLSLAAAGPLQTNFQMSSSVSQLGFGHLADRWRHPPLPIAGPLLSVIVLPLVGPGAGAGGTRGHPDRRRSGRGGVSSARGGDGPLPERSAGRMGDGFLHHGGRNGFLDRPGDLPGREQPRRILRRWLADRWGPRRVIVASLVWSVPFFVAAPLGTGGLCVPLVGRLADRVGIESALELMALTPLAAALLALPLPVGHAPAVVAPSRPDLTD